ncbi:MAG: hypothetical protein ACUVQ6_03415 [Dissulfurimicrobium sp.]|uniref:hypothetical protein n=1 Tax=Dissulfurimicrobium sp. TaxID=2022436 RepID=UPI00404A5240
MYRRPFAGLFLICLASIFLFGCGQAVKDPFKPIKGEEPSPPVYGKSIVLLPLADYTQGSSPDDALRRQMKLNTSLAQQMAVHGIYSPLAEDVVQYLVELGVIKPIKTSVESDYKRITMELGTGWSEVMQDEIKKIVTQNEALRISKEQTGSFSTGLNQKTVSDIGRHFQADYLLRGRIVEYEIRDGHNMNPLQRGVLPFFFDFTSNGLFGIAESKSYDLWQDMAVGGTIGALLGSEATTPFNPPGNKTEIIGGANPRFATAVTKSSGGYSSSTGLNAATWGATGAGTAYLTSKGGKLPEGVVQVSLALQDAYTGKIVWADRAERQVTPLSMWADPSRRVQIDRAIEEVSKALINNLADALNKMPALPPEPIAEVQPLPPPSPVPAPAIKEPVKMPVFEKAKPKAKKKIKKKKKKAVNPALKGS